MNAFDPPPIGGGGGGAIRPSPTIGREIRKCGVGLEPFINCCISECDFISCTAWAGRGRVGGKVIAVFSKHGLKTQISWTLENGYKSGEG